MIEVERVGEQRDCKHCSRTYGTLGCCSTVSNKWVYSCEEGHREYEKTHKHMTIPEAIEVLAQDLPCETDEDLSEAMTMAIKALEQQLCEDAVSRQAVIKLLSYDWANRPAHKAVESVRNLPPVTPKEKAAEWYEEDGCEGACEGYMSAGVICSQCGEMFCGYIGNYDFCPNCGARMVETQESEDKG